MAETRPCAMWHPGGFLRVLRFPPPVKLAFIHHYHHLDDPGWCWGHLRCIRHGVAFKEGLLVPCPPQVAIFDSAPRGHYRTLRRGCTAASGQMHETCRGWGRRWLDIGALHEVRWTLVKCPADWSSVDIQNHPNNLTLIDTWSIETPLTLWRQSCSEIQRRGTSSNQTRLVSCPTMFCLHSTCVFFYRFLVSGSRSSWLFNIHCLTDVGNVCCLFL